MRNHVQEILGKALEKQLQYIVKKEYDFIKLCCIDEFLKILGNSVYEETWGGRGGYELTFS